MGPKVINTLFYIYGFMNHLFFRMSLNDIFLKLESSRKADVFNESFTCLRIIQKYIILDDTDKLFSYLDELMDDTIIPTHFLRLLVHVVLFLDQISTANRRETVVKLLEK